VEESRVSRAGWVSCLVMVVEEPRVCRAGWVSCLVMVSDVMAVVMSCYAAGHAGGDGEFS
jgi:hypothetical protein